MITKIQINKEISLFAQDVDVSKEVTQKSDAKHLIKVIDRSGSMTYCLPSVIDEVKKFSRILNPGDKVTICWFSGVGQHDFMLKSFEIKGADQFIALDVILDQNKTTIGCTCFSEILSEIDNFIDQNKNDNFSMWFLTDGYPVVPNYQREYSAIKKELESLSKKLSYSAFIGTGNYYNRDLMMEMAEITGGSFIHLSDVKNVSKDLTDFAENAADSQPKIKVSIPKDAQFAFSINKKNIIVYAKDENGEINFIPSKTNKNVIFYTSKIAKADDEYELKEEHIATNKSKKEYLIKALYGLSLVMSQKVKTDLAIDVLSYIGDSKLVDALYNSFTNDEYGTAEYMIQLAIFKPEERIVGGRAAIKTNPDAFCIVDFFNLIMDDDNAKFYPFHKDFEYNKITIGTKTKEGYSKFNHDKNQACDFGDLIWNKEKLNLSVRIMQEGTIDLKDGYEKFGLSKIYPCKRFRNYSFVKDGFLNIPEVYVSLSKNTLSKLKKVSKTLVEKVEDINGNEVYKVKLKKLPVMNRKMAGDKLSAKDLCKLIYKERELENKISMYTYLLKNTEVAKKPVTFDEKRRVFLEENGVKNGDTYSPPAETEEAKDIYLAKEFSVDIKGMSAPAAKDVLKKLQEGKNITPREEFMSEAYSAYLDVEFESVSVKISWLKDKLTVLKNELKVLRKQIQSIKFAVLLSKKWFEEFNERADEYVINEDGVTYTLSVTNVEVKI